MKKGFTLIELLAVIAIIGILAVLILPDLISIVGDATDKDMKIQENNISDAAKLYINDYCINPIGDYDCPESFKNKYICLNDIQTSDYIDLVKYKNTVCKGVTVFDGDRNDPTTYLKCGNSYKTTSNESIYSTYAVCFN